MARQRLGITQIDEARHEFERIVKLNGGLKAALQTNSHQRAGTSSQVLFRERMIGTGSESRIINPLNPGIIAQELGYFPAILYVTVKPQRDRLNSLQQQKGAQGR
jgi:hypothetical protein